MVARSASPYTSRRRRARAADFSDRSMEVTRAPARAKLTVSVPIPHPISSTRFPAHCGKPAKPGMCGSTKYFRASTSSKYSRVPTSLGECRMLHGLASQKARTSLIGTSVNGCLRSIMNRRFGPELVERGVVAAIPWSAPVRDVLNTAGTGQLSAENSPEIDHRDAAALGAEICGRELDELRIGCRNQDH